MGRRTWCYHLCAETPRLEAALHGLRDTRLELAHDLLFGGDQRAIHLAPVVEETLLANKDAPLVLGLEIGEADVRIQTEGPNVDKEVATSLPAQRPRLRTVPLDVLERAEDLPAEIALLESIVRPVGADAEDNDIRKNGHIERRERMRGADTCSLSDAPTPSYDVLLYPSIFACASYDLLE